MHRIPISERRGPLLAALGIVTAGLLVFALAHAEPLRGNDPIPDVPSSAKNCLGQAKPAPVLNSLFGIKYGAWGLEHRLRIGYCAPLVKKSGLLFDYSFIQAGYQQHLTPIYLMPGGYLQVAPLSFLIFNFEAAPVLYWPIGLGAAGYYPIDSYESDFSASALPGEDGATALGWYVRGGVTLQLAAPLGPVRLIILNSLNVERWVIGDAAHYFHNKHDLPAANPESFIDNNAIVMAEFKVHRNAQLRLGINDQLTQTFGGEGVSNVVAGVAMLNLSKLGPRIVNFMPILRLGGRTHHPVRQGDFNFILALSFDVNLSKLPARAPETEGVP